MEESWPVGLTQTLALSCAGVIAGNWLRARIAPLERLHIPGPIIGGLLLAAASFALRQRGVTLNFDMALRDVLLVAFFTTVGLNATVETVRRGGAATLVLLALSAAGAILQTVLGVGMAVAFGLNPLLGIVAGPVTLAGGPGTALAFGPMLEQMGATGATAAGVACGMFGIAVAGLLGGVAGGRLIERDGLRSEPAAEAPAESQPAHSSESIFAAVMAAGIAMGLGSLVSAAIKSAGVNLPPYMGAMVVAAILRNTKLVRVSDGAVQQLGQVALSLFIVMALLTLKLWELAALAAPLLAILAAQTALMWILCRWVVYPVLGRTYDAAVMTAGYCGFMLGITANAVACMGVLTRRFGPSPRAFIAVPVVGAFLIDFVNSLLITFSAEFVRRFMLRF